MIAPDAILQLIDRFHRNLAAYKQGKYNETQVRREFIDPFFDVVGFTALMRRVNEINK